MQTRTKVVEMSGNKYQLRRLPPDVGSFIFMRMLGVSMRMSAAEHEARPDKPAEEPSPEALEKVTGEMKVRALAFGVLTNGASFEDFKFIQGNCMKATSIVLERAGAEFPVPIMTDAGAWTPDGESTAADIKLVMNLMTEVLVHCFADSF